MNKKFLFLIAWLSTWHVIAMHLNIQHQLGTIMRQIHKLPHIDMAFMINIANAHHPINNKKALLHYFRQYKEHTRIPLGLSSHTISLAILDYLWKKYVNLRVGVLAMNISDTCYRIVQKHESCLKSKGIPPETWFCINLLNPPDISSNAIVRGFIFYLQQKSSTRAQECEQYRTHIKNFWQESLLQKMGPIALLSFQSNFLTTIIRYEAPEKITVIKDFPLKFLRETLCCPMRPTILSSWNNFESLDNLLKMLFFKGSIETVPTLEAAITHCLPSELTIYSS